MAQDCPDRPARTRLVRSSDGRCWPISEIVGRATERRAVADAVAAVADGRGLVLSISGEPGIGKTNLAGETLRLAGAAGFRTLRGSCARFQADVTLAPLRQALHPLVEPGGDLTAGLTALNRLFGWLEPPDAAPDRDPDTERGRLFDAAHTLLRRAIAHQPVALLIDDIQWADPSSLDLLAYLALCLGEHRCLFVVTDRGEPVDAVRRFRATLRRADRVVDVRLDPLTPDQVAALVADELAGEPPQPLLELLDGRGKGVPLYLISLLASLRARGRLFRSGGRWVLGAGAPDDLPDELVDVIADRLDELAAPELDILAALGVWGDGATRDMIDALLTGDDDLDERLDRLIGAQLVDELVGETVTYQAHHPLVVEAACGRLSARERRLRHAAAALYLLDGPGSACPPPGLVAHHVRLAGPAFDRDRALDILTTATDAEAGAGERGSPEQQLLAESIVTLVRECGRVDLLPRAFERLAEAAALAGDAATATGAWRDAAAAHHSRPAAASRCLRRLALLQLDRGDNGAFERSLDEALALVDGPDSVHERFRVLQLRVANHLRAGAADRLLHDLADIRSAAAQLGLHDLADQYQGYLDRGTIHRLTIPTGSADIVTLAGRLADTLAEDELSMIVPWYRPWIVDAITRGDLAGARHRCRAIPARSAVSPGISSGALALEAYTEWLAGHWDLSLRLTGEALVRAHGHTSPRSVALALTVRGLVMAHRGALDRTEEWLTDARNQLPRGDQHSLSTIDTVAGQLALLRGNSGRALALLDRSGPVNYLGLLTVSLQVTAFADGSGSDRLDRIARDLSEVAGPWAAALARRVEGLRNGDPGALADAASRLADLGMPYESALIALECAESKAIGAHRSDSAVRRVNDALAVFDRLGAAPAADRARRLLRRLGQRTPPGRPTGGSLSEREQQVAGLVAQGLSNADVAARLFISPRTVTTHLERIYRRLGISSRAELSRYVAASAGPELRSATDTGPLPARTD